MKEVNTKKLEQISELMSGNIKSLGLNPIEALIVCASMSETIGDFYLNALMNKSHLTDLEKIQAGRLQKTLEDSKILSLERTKECFILDEFGIRPSEIKFAEDSLISQSLKRRFNLLKEANFKCKYCGRSPPEVQLELEHIFPKCKGGTDKKDNLAVSCRDCNRGKGTDVLNEVCNGKSVESQ